MQIEDSGAAQVVTMKGGSAGAAACRSALFVDALSTLPRAAVEVVQREESSTTAQWYVPRCVSDSHCSLLEGCASLYLLVAMTIRSGTADLDRVLLKFNIARDYSMQAVCVFLTRAW
jgi:hypothetical protein